MGKRMIWIFVLLLGILGCETVSGVTQDVANTARNIRDIFTAGKTIHDAVQ